jgi:hypothetical protein
MKRFFLPLAAIAVVILVPAASGALTAGKHSGSAGKLEVRGTVTTLTDSSIIVTVSSLPVPCAIPAGQKLTVKAGDMIELRCDLVGDPAVWTFHVAKGASSEGHHGSGHGDSSEVKVRGTIAAAFTQTATLMTVTPKAGGPDVACAIGAGSLPTLAAGDLVKMECAQVGGTLTLKKIKKKGSDNGHH